MHLVLVLALLSKKCSTESALIYRGANEETIVFYTGYAF